VKWGDPGGEAEKELRREAAAALELTSNDDWEEKEYLR
jgi:hypothetical protein